MGLFGLFNREKREDLDKGLEKSKESIIKRISRAVAGKAKVDDEVLDNLEEALISSDVGVNTTLKIIEKLETRVRQDKYMSTEELGNILSEVTISLLEENTTDTGKRFGGIDYQALCYYGSGS
jgi:fused signal recognition particle receptor